jgi:hypothetical protein
MGITGEGPVFDRGQKKVGGLWCGVAAKVRKYWQCTETNEDSMHYWVLVCRLTCDYRRSGFVVSAWVMCRKKVQQDNGSALESKVSSRSKIEQSRNQKK